MPFYGCTFTKRESIWRCKALYMRRRQKILSIKHLMFRSNIILMLYRKDSSEQQWFFLHSLLSVPKNFLFQIPFLISFDAWFNRFHPEKHQTNSNFSNGNIFDWNINCMAHSQFMLHAVAIIIPCFFVRRSAAETFWLLAFSFLQHISFAMPQHYIVFIDRSASFS